MVRGVAREMMAEFLGTFVLIVFGIGVVAQTVLSRQTAGSPLSINIGWGLAVTMGCYVSAGVTGAHLNPAVTLALAVHRRFPWRKVVPYAAAQLAGAFVASAVVYLTYREALNVFDGGVRQVVGTQGTAGIWATYPQPFLSADERPRNPLRGLGGGWHPGAAISDARWCSARSSVGMVGRDRRHDHFARIRLFFGWCSSSHRPSASMRGGM